LLSPGSCNEAKRVVPKCDLKIGSQPMSWNIFPNHVESLELAMVQSRQKQVFDLEVSMCIDPVTVGGDGGHQNNKKY
jgi:hypothetical protein